MASSSNYQYDPKTIQSLRRSFQSSLSEFATTEQKFKILCSVPDSGIKAPLKTLYILDSSFNPPTKAHMHLARSALVSQRERETKLERGGGAGERKRLLLLLAIKNADKAPKPAAFKDRLVMMTLMAEELAREENVLVDVGVTSEPFYYKKAEVVEESGVYDGLGGPAGTGEQVHITGFDTIVRIFNNKYYEGPEGMGVLQPMFEKGRLRVHLRDGDEKEQRRYLEEIRSGRREDEGVKASWAERIEIVDPMEDVVSSTEARKCAVENNGEGLEKYVGESVRSYIMLENLYDEESLRKGA